MKENRFIGVHQFTNLVILFGVGSAILTVPALLAAEARQDAWLSALSGTLAGLVPIAVYIRLGKRFPRKSLVEMNELIFGKWIGKLVSVLYLMFFFVLCVLLLGEAGYFLGTEVIPETPILVTTFCLMAIAVMAARLGPEVIARGAEVVFPWVVLLFTTFLLMLLPQIKPEKVQPVLEEGLIPVMRGTLPFMSLQEYIVLLMIYPYVKASKKTPHAFYAGHLIAGSVLTLIMLLCILVLGPELTKVNLYPSFTLAKKISVGEFIERVEVIMGGLWFFTIMFKLILSFFAAVAGTSQLFRFKSYTFLTIPMSLLALACLLPAIPNIVFLVDFLHHVWPPCAMFFMLALPLLAWIVSMARGKESRLDFAGGGRHD